MSKPSRITYNISNLYGYFRCIFVAFSGSNLYLDWLLRFQFLKLSDLFVCRKTSQVSARVTARLILELHTKSGKLVICSALKRILQIAAKMLKTKETTT